MIRSGTLFCVSTPIGNLGDLSSRAVETFHRIGEDEFWAIETYQEEAEFLGNPQSSPHSVGSMPRTD